MKDQQEQKQETTTTPTSTTWDNVADKFLPHDRAYRIKLQWASFFFYWFNHQSWLMILKRLKLIGALLVEQQQQETNNIISSTTWDDVAGKFFVSQNLSNKAPMSFILFLLIQSSIMIDDFKKNEAHRSYIPIFRGSLRSYVFSSAIELIASKKKSERVHIPLNNFFFKSLFLHVRT